MLKWSQYGPFVIRTTHHPTNRPKSAEQVHSSFISYLGVYAVRHFGWNRFDGNERIE